MKVFTFLLFAIIASEANAQSCRGLYAYNYIQGECSWVSTMDAQDGVADDWDMISPCVNFAYSVLTSTPGIHVGQLCEYIDSNCAMLVLTGHGVTNSSNNLYYFPEMCAASEPLVAERQALINAGGPPEAYGYMILPYKE